MKPLTPRVLEILGELGGQGNDPSELIFPCRTASVARRSRKKVALAVARPFRRWEVWARVQECAPGISQHGFRSTFTDWARLHGHPRDFTKMCLGQKVKTATDEAYWREEHLDDRRRILESWALFCCSQPVGEPSEGLKPAKEAGRPTAISQRDQIIAMRQAGERPGEIARKLGFARTTIHWVSSGQISERQRIGAAQAAKILALRAAGERPADIAHKLGIHVRSVWDISGKNAKKRIGRYQ